MLWFKGEKILNVNFISYNKLGYDFYQEEIYIYNYQLNVFLLN